MESKGLDPYRRPHATELARRLAEPRRYPEVVTGARQVGMTTLVRQVTEDPRRPVRFVSADEPTLRDRAWLRPQWDVARLEGEPDGGGLVVDDVVEGPGLGRNGQALVGRGHA